MDDNNNLLIFGIGDQKPVIMELNPVDATILEFTSLDKVGATDTTMPWYKTYAALYHDVKDRSDGQAYYYASFIMEDYLQIVKIRKADQAITWNYQYYVSTTSNTKWQNMKVPGFLHQDPNEPTRMFLIGMWTWRASVLKFNKRNAAMDWKLEINDGETFNTADA